MIDPDSITIRQERFDECWDDGARLRADHAAEVGPRDGVTLNTNVPLLRQLDQLGLLQIMTIRSNGRIFGYLATIISPSLEDAAMLVGTQTGFYVAKEFRGAGARLQRESIEALRAKGVGEVILRAGVRGCGPKLGALYRRIGAEPFGELYSLRLA